MQGCTGAAGPAAAPAPLHRHSHAARPPAAAAEAQTVGADKWNTSYYPTGADAAAVSKPWYIIDAEGQTLGRLANLAAYYIRGKQNPTFTPSMDMGAYVVVINADKVAVTGKKVRRSAGRGDGGAHAATAAHALPRTPPSAMHAVYQAPPRA